MIFEKLVFMLLLLCRQGLHKVKNRKFERDFSNCKGTALNQPFCYIVFI